MSAKKPAPAPAKSAAAPAKPGAASASKTAAPVAAANDAKAAPAKKRRALPVLAALLALCAAGGGGWHYLRYQESKPAPVPKSAAGGKAVAKSAEAEPVFLALEPFTVNLTTVSIDRFLQIGVTLELDSTEAGERVKRFMPVVRSRMLLLLASKTAEEISTPAGKRKLVEDLLREARAPLPDSGAPHKGVENLHFSAFVVQ